MKKYLLLGTSLIVASSAYAAFDCTKQPTCADLGYLQTATDCAGKNMLKCPFETDKVFCGGESSVDDTGANKPQTTGEGCDAVGDILYSDLNCYDTLDKIASGVEPIAVVFDTENRLAIGLVDGYNQNGGDLYIPFSKEFVDVLPQYQYPDDERDFLKMNILSGLNSTTKLAESQSSYNESEDEMYAVEYCYNYHKYGKIKDENLSAGKWFIPSVKEMLDLCNKKETIDNTMRKIGGNIIAEEEDANHCLWTSTIDESVGDYSSYIVCGCQYNENYDSYHYMIIVTPGLDDTKAVRCAIQY